MTLLRPTISAKKRFEFLLHGFFESVNIQESLVKKLLLSPDKNSDRKVVGKYRDPQFSMRKIWRLRYSFLGGWSVQSLWMVVAAIVLCLLCRVREIFRFWRHRKLGNPLFQINFRRCTLLRRYAFQRHYAFHTHPWQHLIRSMCGTLSIICGIYSVSHLNIGWRWHWITPRRCLSELHSDDLPAPSRSGELGTDGDGAFRFYRRRDHARTNHRTARILCRCSGFSRGLLHCKCHNIC